MKNFWSFVTNGIYSLDEMRLVKKMKFSKFDLNDITKNKGE